MYEIFETLLKEKDLTAYKVSKATGVTTATLTNWKQGKYIPKQDKLQKLADYLGVSVDYLMGINNDHEKERLETLFKTFGTQAIALIAKNCKLERINRDLTEKNVAKSCNIDLQTYLSFESDFVNIGIENIIRILSFFNTEINYVTGFLTGALLNFENDEQIGHVLTSLNKTSKADASKLLSDNIAFFLKRIKK